MVVAIVPAYNEEKIIGEVIGSLRSFVDKIIVVNDGSHDATAVRAREAGAEVITHLINRGQGAALETGRVAAIHFGADVIITFDADGQLNPHEIPAIVAPIRTGECDVVLGSRFLSLSTRSPSWRGVRLPKQGEYGEAGRDLVSTQKKSNIPPLRRLLLKCATVFTRLTTGLRLTDTHNGFRAFSRAAAEKICITQDKMAHASEILEKIAKLKLKYKEAPVTIKYTEYSLRKGQKLTDFVKILKDLFWGKLL